MRITRPIVLAALAALFMAAAQAALFAEVHPGATLRPGSETLVTRDPNAQRLGSGTD